MFSAHDLDHDGKVGKEEFAQAAKKLGFEVGGDTDENSLKLDEMMGFFDADHNGQVELDEFKAFVTSATQDFGGAKKKPAMSHQPPS